MSQFNNHKEILTDHNIGTGAVECGTYVGSALIICGAIWGEADNAMVALASSGLFFVLGQLVFITFSYLYAKALTFDIHSQIEADNPAAGVSYGCNLIAIGLLLNAYLRMYSSMLGFIAWAALGTILLLTCRYMVDKLIIGGHSLDSEISQDRNWGAAFIEGFSSIVLAILVSSAYL